jgi:integrase
MARISDFLTQYHSESTRKTYASGVYAFLSLMFDTVPKWDHRDREYESLAERYFTENRNYSEDVIRYAGTFAKSPATTARTRITSVKEFLVFHDIEIREKDVRTIRRTIPKGGASTVEKDLDATVLQSIIQHCTLWLRAMVLLMASSGLRIGEVLTLDLSDINLDGDIGVITVRGPKGGTGRYTFCSVEAADTIREWLKKMKQIRSGIVSPIMRGITKES